MKAWIAGTRSALFVACLGCAAGAGADGSIPQDAMRQTFRMNLGGESGTYTDWEMGGVRGFHELRATIDVSKVHGKPRDEWAALVRLALLGPGPDSEREQCSVLLIHDRKRNTRSAVYEAGGERFEIDFELPPDGKLELGMKRVAPAEIRIDHGDRYIDVACDVDIVAVRALGSGVDVALDPLTVTSAAP